MIPGLGNFVELLKNTNKARDTGLLVAAEGSDRLQTLQSVCFDGQTWNRCFTARYRIRSAPAA